MSRTSIIIMDAIVVVDHLMDSVFSIVLKSRQDNFSVYTFTSFNLNLLMISNTNNFGAWFNFCLSSRHRGSEGEWRTSLGHSINTCFNGERSSGRETSGNGVGDRYALRERSFHSEILGDWTGETISEVTIGSIEGSGSGGQIRPHWSTSFQTGRVTILSLLIRVEMHIIRPATEMTIGNRLQVVRDIQVVDIWVFGRQRAQSVGSVTHAVAQHYLLVGVTRAQKHTIKRLTIIIMHRYSFLISYHNSCELLATGNR